MRLTLAASLLCHFLLYSVIKFLDFLTRWKKVKKKIKKASTLDVNTAYDPREWHQGREYARKGLLTYYVAVINIVVEETQENKTQSLASVGQLAEPSVSILCHDACNDYSQSKSEMLPILDIYRGLPVRFRGNPRTSIITLCKSCRRW